MLSLLYHSLILEIQPNTLSSNTTNYLLYILFLFLSFQEQFDYIYRYSIMYQFICSFKNILLLLSNRIILCLFQCRRFLPFFILFAVLPVTD